MSQDAEYPSAVFQEGPEHEPRFHFPYVWLQSPHNTSDSQILNDLFVELEP
jgi:hypothetical protein